MTQIRPFRGWRFSGDVSGLIAPPYDILSAADKQALLARSADNIVAVDLPHYPPKETGTDEEYRQAAEKLAQLRTKGLLVQDSAPCLYAYSQSFTWAGRSYRRRAILCGVRATEFYEGVWPHEKTMPGPKADRLKLTEATRMQLSPIFGFFEDASGASETLWSAARGEPTAHGTLNGIREELWAVSDPETIAAVSARMIDRPIFIADGHHRYTTALNYLHRLEASGHLPPQHEARFVMFALVPMDGPQAPPAGEVASRLLVLPTHRLLSGLGEGYGCEDLMSETRDDCQWRRVDLSDRLLDDADGFLQGFGPGAMAFLDRRLDAAYVATPTSWDLMDRLCPDEPKPWRRLDVAVLHKQFLEHCVAPHCPMELHVGYTPHGREVQEALKGRQCQMAAMLQATPLQAVKEIALARSVMPPKSTYFYPKLTTGMVLKPLT